MMIIWLQCSEGWCSSAQTAVSWTRLSLLHPCTALHISLHISMHCISFIPALRCTFHCIALFSAYISLHIFHCIFRCKFHCTFHCIYFTVHFTSHIITVHISLQKHLLVFCLGCPLLYFESNNLDVSHQASANPQWSDFLCVCFFGEATFFWL